MQKKHYIISIITILFLGLAFWQIFPRLANGPENKLAKEKILNPGINGVLVDPEVSQQRPLAVVIENHPDARPQSGLSDADIVYETLAEGGITRFLAIFQTRKPGQIGPVRSARPYFSFLANQWNALYAHAGGSELALKELSNNKYLGLFDVNEFSYSKYFLRSKERSAPHNLYTTTENLTQLLTEKNKNTWAKQEVFKFQNTKTSELTANINNIFLPFSTNNFNISFKYDPGTNTYQRFIGNQAQIDANNKLVLSPKTILVQLVNIAPNLEDEKGTVNINLTSSGPCYLFNSGQYKPCKWIYQNGQTKYTNEDNSDLVLDPGQIWIALFPRDKQNLISWN